MIRRILDAFCRELGRVLRESSATALFDEDRTW